MKIWVTKYALTKGILIFEHATTFADQPRLVKVRRNGYDQYFHGEQWHSTEADAIMMADTMRIKKITSSLKQIKKLEAMKFKPTSVQEN